jgi:hypothetical protein
VSAVDLEITEPGVYELPADVYHAHPALSSSGARLLLPPNCPALYRWRRDHPPEPTRTFDFGHAAHSLVLGEGHELVVVDAKDWRTNAAKDARDAAHADGKVPLLKHEHETALAMADALREHPIAGPAMSQPGKAEQSLFRQDAATGVWLRARIDWLPEAVDGRVTITDYKTAASAEPTAFARSVARFGYAQQDAWYSDMTLALGLADEVEFWFIAQEKTPPYLVQPYRLDPFALKIGRRLNREAIELFARCVKRDEWPSYSEGVETLSLPAWMEDEEMVIDD